MTTPAGLNVLAEAISEKVRYNTPVFMSRSKLSSSKISPAASCCPAPIHSTSSISFIDRSCTEPLVIARYVLAISVATVVSIFS